MKIDPVQVESILFITLSNLGDIILTTPVLEKLHDEFPGAKVDVITGIAGQDIFRDHPAVREVITLKRRKSFMERISELIVLRHKKYDLAVDLKNSLVPYLVGAKFHSKLSLGSNSSILHKKEEHLSKLISMGIDNVRKTRFFMPVTDDERNNVNRILGAEDKRKVVVVNPGAKSHLKRWGNVKYAEVINKLVSGVDCRVFITGDENDREVIEQVALFVKVPVMNLCGKTSIGELAELMRKASLVITNDSAPLHVASAVGAPTIAIFGPSDDRRYGPLSNRSRVIKPKVACRPCGRALCNIGPVEGCIDQIEAEEVLEIAKEMLSG